MKDLTKNRSQRVCSCSSLCRKWPHALVLTSFFMLILTAFFKWMALDWVVDHQIAQKLQLIPGSDSWNKWKDIPVPIFIRFYVFNCTNPVEFQEGGIPRVQEIGPYTYEEKRIKDISSIDNEKDTITYRQKIIYTFRPELSNGTESDRLVVINVPFVTLSKLTVDMTNLSFAQNIADRNMRQRGERLFTYHTVKEYLFHGYNVQQYLNFLSNPVLSLIGKVKIPSSIATGRFGFYYGKNDTDDGEYVVRTGRHSPQDFGQIVSWNGKTKLDYYHGECNLINGTDGSIAPPFLTKKSKVRLFSTDICRSMYTVFREEVDVKGIKAYRFKMPHAKPIFDHHDFCFCPTGPNMCFKQGVMSMAPCRDDAPIAFSGVHFLDSWEDYLSGIEGLTPQADKHETFLDIEPKTGLVLRASKRVQFNVMVSPNPHMPTFANVRQTLFPFLWAEESALATDELINQVKQELFAPIEMANKASIGGLVSCAGLILLGFMGIIFLGSPSKKKANSVHSENSDSFHGDTGFRSSSRSATSASGISVDAVSNLSSLSGSSTPNGPKSITSVTSVISVMSRATMTSLDKQTMTDSVFIIDEDLTQKLQDKDKITKI